MVLENGKEFDEITSQIGQMSFRKMMIQVTEDIRLKACRLFGIQHIETYQGFKGGKDAIQRVLFENCFYVVGMGEESRDRDCPETMVQQCSH